MSADKASQVVTAAIAASMLSSRSCAFRMASSTHRHDLAVPQNATGIPEHTELEREGKPCLRRPITADDLDILGNEAVMADERLLGVRQQKQRVPLRFGQRQSCRHVRPPPSASSLSFNHLTSRFFIHRFSNGLCDSFLPLEGPEVVVTQLTV